MADRIDDLVGQEAYDQVIKLDKLMSDLVTRFDLVAKSAMSMQVAIGDTKKINEVISAQQKQAKSLDEIEKLEKKLADTMTLKAQLMQEIKSKQQEEVLNNKAFIKSVQAQEGSINQLRLQLNQATKAYDAMAKAERESGKGTTLLTNIQNTTTALKQLEANTGRFQRNVGNYTNATFQLTQVMRELPNFAQSAEIGIRSLSNNLPMLGQAFGDVRKQAGGTIPALKIFASSLLTFAGIFPLVLMGLIAYSDEIIEFTKSLFTATNSQKELNDAMLEGAKNATAELKSVERLYKATQDTTLSLEQRKKAVDELQKEYPAYFANIKDEIILNGGAVEQYNSLTKSILATARAKAIESKITEIINKDLDTEIQLMDNQAKAIEKYNRLKGQKVATQGFGAGSFSTKALQPETDKERLEVVRQAEKSLSDFKRAQNEKLKALEDALDKEDRMINKHGGSIINNKPASKGTTAPKQPKAPKAEKAERIDVVLSRMADNLIRFSHTGAKDVQKNLNESAELMKQQIDNLLKEIKEKSQDEPLTISIEWTWQDSLTAFAEKAIPVLENINEVVSNAQQATSNITSTLAERATLEAEQQIAKIDEVEKRQLDAIDRLSISEKEKDERKKKVELEAEARRKKIERDKITDLRKYATFQKGADILAITSTTALAVMKALATTPPNIPLAISSGILGASQLAKVIATPLPQYEFGTPDGGHKGGLAQVGEAGAELGIRPDGSIFLTPSKTSIMDLPKRTQIIPHDITKDILGATMINLAKTNQVVTLERYQDEMIEAFEKGTDKIANEIRKNKTNISIGSDFSNYVKYSSL